VGAGLGSVNGLTVGSELTDICDGFIVILGIHVGAKLSSIDGTMDGVLVGDRFGGIVENWPGLELDEVATILGSILNFSLGCCVGISVSTTVGFKVGP
jgi:hypothetical protein